MKKHEKANGKLATTVHEKRCVRALPWESEMAFSHWALQVLATKFEFKMAWVHAPRWPGKQYRKRAIIEWKLLNGYSTIKCVILKLKRFRWHDRTLVLMLGPSRNTIYRYQMLLIQCTHNILKWSFTGVSILVLPSVSTLFLLFNIGLKSVAFPVRRTDKGQSLCCSPPFGAGSHGSNVGDSFRTKSLALPDAFR